MRFPTRDMASSRTIFSLSGPQIETVSKEVRRGEQS